MQPEPEVRYSPWFSWICILGLAPAVAYFLAQLCGFEPGPRTLQIILLVEVCMVTAGVGLMLLLRAFGPWTDYERVDKEWLPHLTPQPGSMLADLAANPEGWNATLENYLRTSWRNVAAGGVPNVAVVDGPGQTVASIRSAPSPIAAVREAQAAVQERRKPTAPGPSPVEPTAAPRRAPPRRMPPGSAR